MQRRTDLADLRQLEAGLLAQLASHRGLDRLALVHQPGGQFVDVVAHRYAKTLDDDEARRLPVLTENGNNDHGLVVQRVLLRIRAPRRENPAAVVAVVVELGNEQVEPFLVRKLVDAEDVHGWSESPV